MGIPLLERPAARLSAPLKQAARALRAGWRFGLDVALPPLCPACRNPIGQPGGLCPACWARLSFIARPYCERLGLPFAYDPGPAVVSAEAIAEPPAYGRARAAVRYDDVARDLVHAFKYSDRLDLAPTLGGWMAQAGLDLLDGADGLIPVPLHWRRLWARRFNQAAVLASAIADKSGIPVLGDALDRVRPTPQQVGLSRTARASNVQGAFRVSDSGRPAIRGKRLILIDDVLTSGATVDTCARALLRGGAAAVDVLVFARVVDALPGPI